MSSTSARSSRGTISRVNAEQVWPLLTKQPRTAFGSAAERSERGQDRNADLPPSSSATFLTVGAAACATLTPAWVEPVMLTMSTPGCADSISPISAPGPLTTLTVPAGRPSSSMISARTNAASGATPAGLRIVVHPAAMAGASLAASW